MSNKSERFYFDNFVESAMVSCEAAEMLKAVLNNFNADTLPGKLEEIHEIEHKGDAKKHELTSALVKAFITPIESVDIVSLSQNIDEVTDAIEDVLIHIYINNVTKIRKEGFEFAELVIRCCNAMKDMLEEFRNFKKSKTLTHYIIEINRIEEEGDKMYMKSMKDLHSANEDPLTVIAWREIFEYFEKCCDACEDVADIVESITIGNT